MTHKWNPNQIPQAVVHLEVMAMGSTPYSFYTFGYDIELYSYEATINYKDIQWGGILRYYLPSTRKPN